MSSKTPRPAGWFPDGAGLRDCLAAESRPSLSRKPVRTQAAREQARTDQVICEAASLDDRGWFDRHPGRKHRLRPGWPGELGAPSGAWVAIRQLEPGVRYRTPFHFRCLPPVVEPGEGFAARVFEVTAMKRGVIFSDASLAAGGRA